MSKMSETSSDVGGCVPDIGLYRNTPVVVPNGQIIFSITFYLNQPESHFT